MSEQERFAKALEVLSERRNAAFDEQRRRSEEIDGKVPEIGALTREIGQTSAKLSMIILSHSGESGKAIDDLRKRNLEAQEIIKSLLLKNGYPEDYLKVRFSCPECEDTGFVDGKRCACLTKLLRESAADELNAVAPMKVCDFSGFDLSYYSDRIDPSLGVAPRDTMGKILAFCQKYAAGFTEDSPSILMLGQTGLGKTHLSLSIAKEVLRKGYQVLYCSSQDILRSIEKEHFSKDGSQDETLRTVLETDLLILDDLGAEFQTSFYSSAIYNIVNTRLNAGRPTIISSNLSSKELEERYSERVVSRLLTQYTYLRFIGDDVRQLKRARNRT